MCGAEIEDIDGEEGLNEPIRLDTFGLNKGDASSVSLD